MFLPLRIMVTEHKRKYMKNYNQRMTVKEKKAEYMRKVRADKDQVAARNLVSFLLEQGFESIAYDYAMERAPEMLVLAKNGRKPIRK